MIAFKSYNKNMKEKPIYVKTQYDRDSPIEVSSITYGKNYLVQSLKEQEESFDLTNLILVEDSLFYGKIETWDN